MISQHKGTRKDIREDKLVEFSMKAWTYIEHFKKNIMIVVLGLALVVVAYILYSNNKQTKTDAASFELSQVMPVYEMGAFQDAIEGKAGTKNKGLKKIVEEYGSTTYGEVAKIYLGHAYFNLKKFDLAQKAYDDFGGGDASLKATAYAGQASCYEALGQLDKAVELFTKAAKVDNDNVLNPQYLINAGADLLELGKKAEAKELFETVKRDYPKSSFAQGVERYLAQVE